MSIEIMFSEHVSIHRTNTRLSETVHSCFSRSSPKVSLSHQARNLIVGCYASRMTTGYPFRQTLKRLLASFPSNHLLVFTVYYGNTNFVDIEYSTWGMSYSVHFSF
jgi:hypothetical protein